MDTDDDTIETTSLVKTKNVSKDIARKRALQAALMTSVPVKDMRRQVWETYLSK